MTKQKDDSLCGSNRANEIDRLFVEYKIRRDENSKNILCEAVAKVYTPQYVKARRPSFSDLWTEFIYGRLVVKFLHVLSHPECVTKSLTAYLSRAVFSLSADVFKHYSKEAEAEDGAAKKAQTRASERTEEQRRRLFAEIVWNFALNMPDTTRTAVVRLYLTGLQSRAEGVVNKAYTIEGIASKLGLTQTCIATHIRRAKMSLEREFRPLGLKMGVLTQQRHYR